jgi:hypothetical protein
MKQDERKQFLGFTLVGTQVEQWMGYSDAIRIEARGTGLRTTTWGELAAKIWCVFHFWRA